MSHRVLCALATRSPKTVALQSAYRIQWHLHPDSTSKCPTRNYSEGSEPSFPKTQDVQEAVLGPEGSQTLNAPPESQTPTNPPRLSKSEMKTWRSSKEIPIDQLRAGYRHDYRPEYLRDPISPPFPPANTPPSVLRTRKKPKTPFGPLSGYRLKSGAHKGKLLSEVPPRYLITRLLPTYSSFNASHCEKSAAIEHYLSVHPEMTVYTRGGYKGPGAPSFPTGYRLTFGAHKGKLFSEVPDSYLTKFLIPRMEAGTHGGAGIPQCPWLPGALKEFLEKHPEIQSQAGPAKTVMIERDVMKREKKRNTRKDKLYDDSKHKRGSEICS